MARIQIWGGGPYHPCKAQGQWFKEKLEPLGCQVDYSESRELFSPEILAKTDLLILAGLDDPKFMPEAELEYWETRPAKKPSYEPLSEAHFQSLKKYLLAGRPLLVHHTAIISFPERGELADIFDGRWVMDQSFHPPYQKFKVQCLGKRNPLMKGMEDFEIEDEMYCALRGPQRCELLLQCEWEGKKHPLAWAGSYGPAPFVYCGLGHDMNSLSYPGLELFLKNSVKWLIGRTH
jgi:type 1 glutamine amidotransferase